MRYVIMALAVCALLSLAIVTQAVAQNTVWMQRVVPGRVIRDDSQGSNINIRCIPEENRICAVIYIQVDESDPYRRVPDNYGLRTGGDPDDSSRVGLWIPDLNQGYCMIRFDGTVWHCMNNSLSLYFNTGTRTRLVESKQSLEQCLGVDADL